MNSSRTQKKAKIGRPAKVSQQIEASLRCRIRQGEWSVGEMLPSRQDLAEEYGVALNTLQRAVKALIDDGTLRAISSRGTFIARGTPTVDNSLHKRGSVMPQNSGEKTPASDALLGIVLQGTPSELERSEPYAPWATLVACALERAFAGDARSTGCYCIRWNAPGAYPNAEKAIAAAMEDGVSALAVVDVYGMHGFFDNIVSILESVSIPTVILSDRDHKSRMPHLFYDQWTGGYAAARHLITAGYERFVFFQPYEAWWLPERIEGARAAIKEAGFEDRHFLAAEIATTSDFLNMRTQERQKVLEQNLLQVMEEFPTEKLAVIAPTDREAGLLLNVIEEQGVSPGKEIGLVGFDDGAEARLRGITSVRPPMHELGAAAARLLLRALQGEAMPDAARLGPNVIARSSTKRGFVRRSAVGSAF